MSVDALEERPLGLLGATGIGVGAIVGGGILALAGVAFATTGPSAVLAFALNGVIALLTALAFAELASSFPESGGTYTFAKKVLSVEAAFMVGWVVWFASIVAAVLYALGFATFFKIFLEALFEAAGAMPPPWLVGHAFEVTMAALAVAVYAVNLARTQGGGGRLETIGKVAVFLLLIVAGLWALPSREPAELGEQLTPFFAFGGLGLLQAMGYTFIALQGFDLIAAVGGEVRDPGRNLPRSMVASLLIALAIYIPLLLLVSTVGVAAGSSITEVAAADPEAVVAIAVEQYLGRTGFWLVIVAALLSMLSALQANLLAASYIALAMAQDRNLPGRLRQLHERRGTPVVAVLATAGMVVAIVLVIPDVAAAGAMSSLIFLLSFTLAHLMSYLARRRGDGHDAEGAASSVAEGAAESAAGAFRLPLFPLVPVLGGTACLGLAIFQGLAVPSAGVIGAVWLLLGGVLYVLVFSRRARVADAAAEALDPQLLRLRGRAPLVLVPIANPASAEALVTVASAMAPPRIGRVLLLYVVETPEEWSPEKPPPQLLYAQQVLGEALTTSFAAHRQPEALTTISPNPWQEIARVAGTYHCESLLLGVGDLDHSPEGQLAWLLGEVACDVVLLRAPEGWHLHEARRVLVPVGGRDDQSHLRARLLGSLCRTYPLEVVYLGILPPDDPSGALEREIRSLADVEAADRSTVQIIRSDDVGQALVDAAKAADLVILGLRREGTQRKAFGEIPKRVARETRSAVLLIGSR